MKSDFFSSTTRISQAFARKAGQIDSIPSTSQQASTSKHPLVVELHRRLYDDEIYSSPAKIWDVYNAIHQQALSEGVLHSPLSSFALTSRDHQAVLRIISRKPKRQDKRETNESSLVSYRYRGALLSGQRKAPDNVSSYLEKVLFIFSQLKQSEREHLPSTVDYDTVLERLAPGGNMPALTALWAHLTGSTAEDFSLRHTRKMDLNTSSNHQPTPRTYLHLMMGISRHLTLQIQRIHKESISDDIWKGQGKKRQRKENASALAASRGQTPFGQKVTPQSRLAVRLASARTVSLLEDLIHRQIKPGKITVDLALRILRMDGSMKGIKLLMKVFGVDLNHPDAERHATMIDNRTEGLATDIHTLNTIVMAYGEQGTISEMITAYETLSKPLPTRQIQEQAVEDSTQGSLFATDWRGIFQKDSSTNAVEKDEASTSSEQDNKLTTQYDHPFAILPNTTTMTVMIKHCCNAPDPARMVASLEEEGSTRGQFRMEDHIARQEGAYRHVACYLLAESLDLQEREVMRMAKQLGMEMPSVEMLSLNVSTWLQQYEKESDMMETPEGLEEVESVVDGEWSKLKGKEGFFAKVIEQSREPIIPLEQLSKDFIPHFLPPGIGVNYDMIQPIAKLVSRKRTAAISHWRWLITQTQRAIALKMAELQVIHEAIERWDVIRQEANYQSNLSNVALQTMLKALRNQRRMIRAHIMNLGTPLIDRMMHRFRAMRQLRRKRQNERFARKVQDEEKKIQAQLDSEHRKDRLALQREEKKLAEQQGNEVLPAQEEATSIASAFR